MRKVPKSKVLVTVNHLERVAYAAWEYEGVLAETQDKKERYWLKKSLDHIEKVLRDYNKRGSKA